MISKFWQITWDSWYHISWIDGTVTWGAIFLYRICLMNCFEMWIFKGLMLFNWEISPILKCNPHLNVFYIHICATNRPKLCWDKSWDIDIKIKGKIVGHWYQEFHGVPLEINCVYSEDTYALLRISHAVFFSNYKIMVQILV